jgi:glucose-1-phosphate thymidylyltransferase
MLGPSVVERLRRDPVVKPNGEADVTSTIAAAMREQPARVLGWRIEGEWLDTGTLDGLLYTQSRLLRDVLSTPVRAADSEVVGAVNASEGAEVVRTRIVGPALLGRGALLEDCDLEQVVIGDGARLRGTRLRRSLVLPGAQVEGLDYEDVIVQADGTVCGPGVRVPETNAAN